MIRQLKWNGELIGQEVLDEQDLLSSALKSGASITLHSGSGDTGTTPQLLILR